jgi:uncharacterized protein (TIGR02757 family)
VLAPVAYLSGLDIVRECLTDEVISKFLHQVMFNELIETLDLPKDELNQFANDVLDRFNNPFVKHLSDVAANSSAKRLNMYLRWMVRSNDTEVDFGLWKNIPASALMLPLDVHTGDVARAYGLLARKQNDWKAVEEITSVLREFDPADPIKYDFALFGIGAFENKKALESL